MIELTTRVIAVTIESLFAQTRPFSKERLDQIGVRALDLFRANGLRPEHIGLRTVDVLFGYELNFSLFGGSATFQLTGARLTLNFQNIATKDALQVSAETASREFLGHLAHFRIPEWQEAIRLQIDRSIFFPPGLFLSWNTVWRGQVDLEVLTQAAKAFEITANRFEFSFVVP